MGVQEEAVSLSIGARFGAYEIIAHHGSGGMADIWVAREAEPVEEHRIAIKTLLKQRAHHSEYVDRFAQEAELHGRLEHPNIARFLETGVESGARYLALEFIEGLNLRQMIHAVQPRRLPLHLAFDLMADICDALHYVHELAGPDGALGVVHGDVSPENVMIGLDGKVKLIDFGLATATLLPASSKPSATVLETSVVRPGRHVPPGRLQYLAPERVHGRVLDRRSDIYSVGAMLFELVHGMRPFQAEVTYELLTRICQGAAVAGDPNAHPAAKRVIEQAMTVVPDERIATAKEMADMLRSCRDLVVSDEQSLGLVVRRVFGLEETDEAEEIDLMWSDENATAQIEVIESPSHTPLLEEGTELDVQVRELLREIARSSFPAAAGASSAKASGWPEPAEAEAPEPKSVPLPDLFASSPRPPPVVTTDLFGIYGKRPPPSSGTFLAHPAHPSTLPVKAGPLGPGRVAAAHFEMGWKLLREGKAEETLAEWEAAMDLDPDNRSYAVNVQKLRMKLQR